LIIYFFSFISKEIFNNKKIHVDRTTEIGKMINAYLTNATEMDDNALHLLFSANRWEAVYEFL